MAARDPNNPHRAHTPEWERHNERYLRKIRSSGVPAGQPGRSGCFPAGTPIRTPEGERPIESLRAGDSVVAPGSLGVARIQSRRRCPAARIWEVRCADPELVIRTTSDHLLRASRGWTRVDRLREGDRLIPADPSTAAARVASVRCTAEVEPVFNLIVADALTFVANGVTAHSFSRARLPRTWLHRVRRSIYRALRPSKCSQTMRETSRSSTKPALSSSQPRSTCSSVMTHRT